MSWDLALDSKTGDAIFNLQGQLAFVSGTDLLEQRMRVRLQVHRGSWPYDDANSLGSRLYTLSGVNSTSASQLAPAIIREALRDMADEIEITDISVTSDDRSLLAVITYRVLDERGDASADDTGQLIVTF